MFGWLKKIWNKMAGPEIAPEEVGLRPTAKEVHDAGVRDARARREREV